MLVVDLMFAFWVVIMLFTWCKVGFGFGISGTALGWFSWGF